MDNYGINNRNFPIAMAYVPEQRFREVFDTQKALQQGTIFPELCKPFCGNGGIKRW